MKLKSSDANESWVTLSAQRLIQICLTWCEAMVATQSNQALTKSKPEEMHTWTLIIVARTVEVTWIASSIDIITSSTITCIESVDTIIIRMCQEVVIVVDEATDNLSWATSLSIRVSPNDTKSASPLLNRSRAPHLVPHLPNRDRPLAPETSSTHTLTLLRHSKSFKKFAITFGRRAYSLLMKS